MQFPLAYKCLRKNAFHLNGYSIVPIRYEDRFKIMQWRNEQIYHLRQAKPLTKEDQDKYFISNVAVLFDKDTPDQLLFSYLHGSECIGYGGLVHINWIDKNAEISFIINTALERDSFQFHWNTYLQLIEGVAFQELALHKIYTYAFDLRPHLYRTVESAGYKKEATLAEHCFFEGEYKNVVIHSKINESLTIRPMLENDKQLTFDWANDELTRQNSFNSDPILFEQHAKWFDAKIQDQNAYYFICEVGAHPAGLIRFDNDPAEDACIAGITISNKFRGKKLGVKFLKMACAELEKSEKKPVIAYIKKNNAASVKIFESAGFALIENAVINGIRCYKYRYTHQDKFSGLQ